MPGWVFDMTTEVPPGTATTAGVLVTFAEMYGELVRLTAEVRTMNDSFRTSTVTLGDHETRLRSLERWRYTLPTSLVLAIGSTAAALAALFVHH